MRKRRPVASATAAGTPAGGALVRRQSQGEISMSGGHTMKMLLSGVAIAAIVAVALPAWSQTSPTPSQSTQQNVPGTGGTFKPGTPGLPGSKSGPTVTPSGTTLPEANRSQPSGDQSNVPGLPGGKSGPTVKPSGSAK
jgi:hypothetical protein